jgi:sugar lactone lactonase YvrE
MNSRVLSLLHRSRLCPALVLALVLGGVVSSGVVRGANAGQLSLVAGNVGDAGVADGPIAVARFTFLAGIAVDGGGNIYVADNHAIRRISADGTVATIAGRVAESGYSDGPGTTARFNSPHGLAADAAGNVYVADRDNNAIRKINRSGVVSTVAGSRQTPVASDGKGSRAPFFRPSGIAVDRLGNLFVADTYNYTIRKISPDGVVSTIAGRAGEAGSADGAAAAARFGFVEGIAVDANGNVYVADSSSHVIRKISAGGIVTTFAGQAGAMGTADGSGAAARFFYPNGLAIDQVGNLYVADSHSRTIRKITSTATVTTIAGTPDRQGTDDGPGATARFNSLHGVAVDRRGNVYVTDFAQINRRADGRYTEPGPSGTVRRIDPMGLVSTVAGAASEESGAADGAGAAARFESPTGIAVDRSGNMYVTDANAYTLRRITASGQVTTLAGKADERGHKDGFGAEARFQGPIGIALDGAGMMYVADPVDGVIRRVTPDGSVSTIAGAPGVKGSIDGVGAGARFSSPSGIAVDGAGNLYVTDGWVSNIRKVTPAGEVTTLAGKAGEHGSADGPAERARFNVPAGIAADRAGNLFVCDYGDRTIRKITPRGEVSTVAGRAGVQGSSDGTGAAARFMGPTGIAIDDVGNLYVSDAYTIRRITPEGVVTTIAGVPGEVGIKLGNLPGRLESPSGVAVIDANTLVLTARNSVLKIRLRDETGIATTPARR